MVKGNLDFKSNNMAKITEFKNMKRILQRNLDKKEDLKNLVPKQDNTALFNVLKKSGEKQILINTAKDNPLPVSEVPFREGNIALILDSYNDIFSDFDPRPYSQRALSDDFLAECRRASRDKQEAGLELRLFVPKDRRVLSEEVMIRRRLKNHFEKHYLEKVTELRAIRTRGLLWVVIGAIALLVSTGIEKYQSFLIDFLFIVSQPAGWFLMWSGLEEIFIDPRDKKPELEFYKKLANAKVTFYSY